MTYTRLSTGGQLRTEAAHWYEWLIYLTGTPGTNGDPLRALRTYQDQLTVWNNTYTLNKSESDGIYANGRTWNGKFWWRRPGRAQAARPGTSNHGSGNTVDFVGVGGFGTSTRNRFMSFADPLGFDDTEGREIGEPWHLTYLSSKNQYKESFMADITASMWQDLMSKVEGQTIILRRIEQFTKNIASPDAVASAVVKAFPTGTAGATKEQIAAAVKTVLAAEFDQIPGEVLEAQRNQMNK